MSADPTGVVVYVFVLGVGVLMIISTLLHRAGVTWFSPRKFRQRPVPVGASLLLGAGMVLSGGTHLTPADHQPVWGLMMMLKSLTVCLFLASLVLFTISTPKPGLDKPEHD